MMKRRTDGSKGWNRGLAGLGLVLAAALWGGCDPKVPTSAAAPSAPPAKGDPIRGEPITAPAQAAAPSAPPPASGTGAPADPVPVTPAVAVAAPPASPPAGSTSIVISAVATSLTPAAAAAAPGTTSAVPAVVTAKAGAGTPESPLVLAFDKLASFQYTLPDGPVETNLVAQTTSTNQIPANIRELNNRFVTLKGFMLPLKVEKGLVTELLIMRDQSMCCYGTVPKINEWVSVKMVGIGVKPVMDQAVTLAGRFKVGEMYENGYLVGIYAMDGEKLAGPLDL